MGELFGDAGLKELIDPIHYLNSSPMLDEFLEGMSVGMKRAAERKARMLQNQKGKQPGGFDSAELINSVLKEGNS